MTAIYRRPVATYLQKEYASKIEYCMYVYAPEWFNGKF